MNLCTLFVDSGSVPYIVSHEDVTPDDAARAHRNVMLLSIPAAILGAFASVLLGGASSTGESVDRALVCCFGTVTACAALIPGAWLQRQNRFEVIQKDYTAGTSFVTCLITLPLAFLRQGYLAVLANAPLQQGFVGYLLKRTSALPKPTKGTPPVRGPYRLTSLVSNGADYISNNADILLLGMFLGVSNLGIYTRVLLIAGLPATFMANILSSSIMTRAREVTAIKDKLKVVIEPIAVISAALLFVAIPGALHLNVVTMILGSKFNISSTEFLLALFGQWCFFSSDPLATLLRSMKKQGWLAVAYGVHAVLLVTAIAIVRPSNLHTAMCLYAINGAARAFAVVLASYLCLSSCARELARGSESLPPST
jgi:O-antigen/teichoic acid export membrane protein